AFEDVYGRPGYPEEHLLWGPKVAAQQAWYFNIVAAETQKLTKDPFATHEMIRAAYLAAFGRVETHGDLQYWSAQHVNYQRVFQAGVIWLYAPQHAQELRQVVTRALGEQFQPQSVKDYDIDQLVAAATPKRMSFAEMLTYLKERH